MGALCCRRREEAGLIEAIDMLPSQLREQFIPKPSTSQRRKTRLQERKTFRKIVDDLLILSAEIGSVRILNFMAKANLWEPSTRVDVLRMASEAGTLIKLLKVFPLPLAACPTLVQLHDVLDVFQDDEDTAFETHSEHMFGMPRSETPSLATSTNKRVDDENAKDWNPTIQPTPQAMLLANIIKVPSPLAEKAMEGIVEDMVVFQPSERLKSRIRKTLRKAAGSETASPTSLPQLQRTFTGTTSQSSEDCIPMQSDSSVWDCADLQDSASLFGGGGASNPSETGGTTSNNHRHRGPASLPSLPLKMNFPESLGAIFLQRRAMDKEISFDQQRRELKHWPEHGDITASSPMFALNFDTYPEEIRRAALIPMKATKFAYLYGAPGGFVYFEKVGDEDRVLAVNAIDFTFQNCALSFGEQRKLTAKACKKLERDGRWFEVNVHQLREKGAVKYSFVGPEEVLADDFTAEPGGGYCYLFADQQYSRYFPIVGAGEVMSRAEVPACSTLNAVMLPEDADGSDMVLFAHPRRCLPLDRRPLQGVQGVPVRFARLRIPGICHPVVLHGLAYTPRVQVLSTLAARAIAQAAFSQHTRELAFDVFAEAVSLLSITRLTSAVRSGEMQEEMPGMDSVALVEFYLAFIIVVWFKNTTDEICLLMGYCYQGWVSDYFTWQKFWVWLHTFGMIVLWCWAGHGSFYGYYQIGLVRPLLATVGAMKWIRLLYAFRGTSTFRLGPRILPIIFALGEVTDFVLITMFFTCACAHVSYALSEKSTSLNSVLFSSYRLGFLADFEIPDDVFFISEGEEAFKWQPFQTAAFILFSFVVSIALTNIFIGVMSNAFDYHSERVSELFVRTRAAIALDHALRGVGRRSLCHHICGLRLTGLHSKWISHDLRIWFCFKHTEQDEDSDTLTVRGTINTMGETILKRLEDLSKFDDLAKRLTALEARLGPQQPSEQAGLRVRGPTRLGTAAVEDPEVVHAVSTPKLLEAVREAAPEPPAGPIEHLEVPRDEEPFAEPFGGSSSGECAAVGGAPRPQAEGEQREATADNPSPKAQAVGTSLSLPEVRSPQIVSPRWQDMAAAATALPASEPSLTSGPSDLNSSTTTGSRCQSRGQTLSVMIVRATGLCNVDTAQQRKAYCTCEVFGKPHTRMNTRLCGDFRYPVWLHQDEVVGFEEGDTLSFTVWEYNFKTAGDRSDRQLGRAFLSDKQLGWAGFVGYLTLDGVCPHQRNGGALQPEAVLQVQVARRRGNKGGKKQKRKSKGSKKRSMLEGKLTDEDLEVPVAWGSAEADDHCCGVWEGAEPTLATQRIDEGAASRLGIMQNDNGND
mmetsp:Transcript_65535/g.166007  ORF Transcript_65535/g.166007 Transcript_65535/m.166007 type:complete len:1320 (+) Transcript_65535:261-4220(+)